MRLQESLNEIMFLRALMTFAGDVGASVFLNKRGSIVHTISGAVHEFLTGKELGLMGCSLNFYRPDGKLLMEYTEILRQTLQGNGEKLAPETRDVLLRWCNLNYYSERPSPLIHMWDLLYGEDVRQTIEYRGSVRWVYSLRVTEDSKNIGTLLGKYCKKELELLRKAHVL